MKILKNIIMLTSLFATLHVYGMDPKIKRNPEWEKTWGVQTAARQSRKADLYRTINMNRMRDLAYDIDKKAAQDLQKRGWDKNKFLEEANTEEQKGHHSKARQYQRLAKLVAQET